MSTFVTEANLAKSRSMDVRCIIFGVLLASLAGCGVLKTSVVQDSASKPYVSLEELLADHSIEPAPMTTFPSPKLESNAAVERYVKYYSGKNRGQIEQSLQRFEGSYPLVLRAFEYYGVPPSMINLGIVESKFDPKATSPAGAAGIWQFMKGTARAYGLQVGLFKDERRHLERSSVAAASMLRDLYLRYGDWYLVLAAYNAGYGKIDRLLRRTGSTDFWGLRERGVLRRETAEYVPKFIAVSLIMRNLEDYGFDRPDVFIPPVSPTKPIMSMHVQIDDAGMSR